MKFMTWKWTLLLLGLLVCPTWASADPKDKAPDPQQPAKAPTDDDIIISKMRVQDYKGGTYFYASAETTLAQIGDTIRTLMAPLGEILNEGKIRPSGAPIFVYKGVTHEMNKPFTLEVGMPVAEGAQPQGDFKVRELEPIHCATVIYSGPVTSIGQAYQQLFQELLGAGLQPTGESREMYLHWDSPESTNNIVLIMIAVK